MCIDYLVQLTIITDIKFTLVTAVEIFQCWFMPTTKMFFFYLLPFLSLIISRYYHWQIKIDNIFIAPCRILINFTQNNKSIVFDYTQLQGCM